MKNLFCFALTLKLDYALSLSFAPLWEESNIILQIRMLNKYVKMESRGHGEDILNHFDAVENSFFLSLLLVTNSI